MQPFAYFSLDYARDLIVFYAYMFPRAFHALSDALSTTFLAIALAVCIFLVALLYMLVRGGIEAMKRHWKENLRIGAFITLALWGAVYILFFIRAIYENHRVLYDSNISLQDDLKTVRQEAQDLLRTREPEAPPEQETPGINIYNAPTDRSIPATRRDSIVKTLARIKCKAYVAASANDREASRLAMEIFGILKDAGWNLPGGGVGSEIGRQGPGITIESYDEKTGSTRRIEGVPDNAAIVFVNALKQLNLQARAVAGGERGLVSGKFLRIIVGPRPPS
jgi:hypothetical protein